ncbi:MAG TPA: hypothetical protein VF831_05575, partial [Anaerolineales bacterium]
LRQEYITCQNLFESQTGPIKQFISEQANFLTDALVQGHSRIRYQLPENIVLRDQGPNPVTLTVPPKLRGKVLGGFLRNLVHFDLLTALKARLEWLERHPDAAVSVSAVLIRHALVMYMVHDYLPAGKNVQYRAEEGVNIPCQLVANPDQRVDSPITPGEAFSETSAGVFSPGRVAFDEEGNLQADDLQEAKSIIDSMRCYLSVLNAAVFLAPYIVVDGDYQNKYYGILGQLVNQGRALASYQVELLCQTIQRRSTSHELDRGLSISMPFFNDQSLEMETYDFDVIPRGRVLFVPAFVVLAVRAEAAKVLQNTRLSQSTRKALVEELCILERAFLR